MATHQIKRGLDIPLEGEPEMRIYDAPRVSRVALVADDYLGLKPTMFKNEGDWVRCGEPLCEDKKNPGVLYTSPGSGTVVAVNRGERRRLISIVVELNDRERSGGTTDEDYAAYESYTGQDPQALNAEQVRSLLLESGMWPALRMRPFSRVPSPEEQPSSIFINAMDSEPLAPNMDVVGMGREGDLYYGMAALRQLTNGPLYFCKAAGSALLPPASVRARVEEFSGPHPAGLVGTHIHFLDPVSQQKQVWHINLQNVLAIGELFRTGRFPTQRIVSLAGPVVKHPRLLRTRVGAALDELVANELDPEFEPRVITGSPLSGRRAMGEIEGYLGRYHNQVCVLKEGRERVFFGWLSPGTEKFSLTRAFVSSLIPDKKFAMTTSTNGSPRAMVPIGLYEKVMPLDILPTFLLRAIIRKDIERGEQLGLLELDEEDLALCTFVCPGKYNYGPLLRENLDIVEREG